MIARLARAWNMTAHLSDDEFAVIEAHLTKHALDGGYAPANQDTQAKASAVKRAGSPRRK